MSTSEYYFIVPFVNRNHSIAHSYLESMKAGSSDEEGSSDDEEEITERLRRERLESQGLYFR